MQKNMKTLEDLISVAMMAVLFLVIHILVVFSAVSYQGAVELRDANDNTRAVLSYVTTAVKGSGGSRVRIDSRGGVDILVIEEGDTGYEQQICFSDGKVLESYGKAGEVPVFEDALVVGRAEQFDMQLHGDGLLEIQTDIGTSYVRVRS